MGVGVVGVYFDGPAIFGNRLIQTTEVVQSIAQAIVCVGKVGLQADGLTIVRHGLIKLLCVLEGFAQVAVGIGKAWIDPNGLATGGDRLFELGDKC